MPPAAQTSTLSRRWFGPYFAQLEKRLEKPRLKLDKFVCELADVIGCQADLFDRHNLEQRGHGAPCAIVLSQRGMCHWRPKAVDDLVAHWVLSANRRGELFQFAFQVWHLLKRGARKRKHNVDPEQQVYMGRNCASFRLPEPGRGVHVIDKKECPDYRFDFGFGFGPLDSDTPYLSKIVVR